MGGDVRPKTLLKLLKAAFTPDHHPKINSKETDLQPKRAGKYAQLFADHRNMAYFYSGNVL